MAESKSNDRAAKVAESRRPAGDKGDDTTTTTGGDASVPARVKADITPSTPEAFGTKAGDVPDPRTGADFEAPKDGLQGRYGFDELEAGTLGVPRVDPDRIPAEVTPGVTPNAGGSELLAAAQAKAPNLTQEFVDAYGLDDEVLAGIANGSVPPPPAIGPIHTADLYLTPGGWQQTPPGVPPEAVGGNAISR
jgi:hypothetical protein